MHDLTGPVGYLTACPIVFLEIVTSSGGAAGGCPTNSVNGPIALP